MVSYSCGTKTHYFRVVLDGLYLGLELVDLALVGRMGNGQVVHGKGPKGGVELRAEVVPDPVRVEGNHSLVYWCHYLFTGRHILLDLLLLPVPLLCFLQFIVPRL